MQNRRRILYIALAGIALTACSNADEPSLPQVKDGVAISFSTRKTISRNNRGL